MRFFKYLFFKYYNWAIKVGNDGFPAFFSIVCISFGITLYFIDIIAAYYFFFSPELNFDVFIFIFPLVLLLSMIILYLTLVSKNKDKIIMEQYHEEWTGKYHWGAVLFPVIAILLYSVELFLKMQMNRGVWLCAFF